VDLGAEGSAKTRDENVEAMRVLRVARLSARRSRTQAINQMRSLISTAPEELRAELRDLRPAVKELNLNPASCRSEMTLRTSSRSPIVRLRPLTRRLLSEESIRWPTLVNGWTCRASY
jgi:transposase